ncbi:MAG: hypothetical protein F6K35_34030 [Okeania sp. SIO2H7]|nr:hypothetical protein [Okeania sp. SIO2H7]
MDDSVSSSPSSPNGQGPDSPREPVWQQESPSKALTALEPSQLREKLPSNCPPTAVELPSNCPTDSGNQWGAEEVADLAEMMRNIESIEELDAFLDTFKEQDEYVKKARNEHINTNSKK